jgi:hypothetical protein
MTFAECAYRYIPRANERGNHVGRNSGQPLFGAVDRDGAKCRRAEGAPA